MEQVQQAHREPLPQAAKAFHGSPKKATDTSECRHKEGLSKTESSSPGDNEMGHMKWKSLSVSKENITVKKQPTNERQSLPATHLTRESYRHYIKNSKIKQQKLIQSLYSPKNGTDNAQQQAIQMSNKSIKKMFSTRSPQGNINQNDMEREAL